MQPRSSSYRSRPSPRPLKPRSVSRRRAGGPVPVRPAGAQSADEKARDQEKPAQASNQITIPAGGKGRITITIEVDGQGTSPAEPHQPAPPNPSADDIRRKIIPPEESSTVFVDITVSIRQTRLLISHFRHKMAILGQHGRWIGLRVLFHSATGSGVGTRSRRHLPILACPVIRIRLFRPASSPRPVSGLPAAGSGFRGVSSSRLLEGPACPSP
jgi:hypothetical protein